MKKACECLCEYMRVIKQAGPTIDMGTCQTLLDLTILHISALKRAGVSLIPKHHLWVHMSICIPRFGNPRMYSTFLDESLNAVIAKIAMVTHRANWERQICRRLSVLSKLKPEWYFANV